MLLICNEEINYICVRDIYDFHQKRLNPNEKYKPTAALRSTLLILYFYRQVHRRLTINLVSNFFTVFTGPTYFYPYCNQK